MAANSKPTRDEAAQFLQAEIAKLQTQNTALEKDMRALMEEYVQASDEDAPEVVKKNIRARMPRALTVLDELLENASDGTRAGLVKWIIDRGLAPDQLGGIDGEVKKLNDLLGQLKPDTD